MKLSELLSFGFAAICQVEKKEGHKAMSCSGLGIRGMKASVIREEGINQGADPSNQGGGSQPLKQSGIS